MKKNYCDDGFSFYQKKFNDMLSVIVARELGDEGICFKEKTDPKLSDRYLVFYNQDYIIFVVMLQ